MTSKPRTTTDLSAIRDRAAAANACVADLCHGRRRWVMQVPASEDDPDLLISKALADIDPLLAAIDARDAEIRALRREVARLSETTRRTNDHDIVD